jgi:hypothetical protein
MCESEEVAAIPSTSMSPPSEVIRGMKEFAFWAARQFLRAFWALFCAEDFGGLKIAINFVKNKNLQKANSARFLHGERIMLSIS